MTQHQNPAARSDEMNGTATTFAERRVPIADDESRTTDVADQATADPPNAAPDVTNDPSLVEHTAFTDSDANRPETSPRLTKRSNVTIYLVLPLVMMCMAVGAGYLKYQDGSVRNAQTAAVSSVQAATEGSVALLSYDPDTAQTTLTAARDRLIGPFRDSYTSLTNDVVIPGAKEKNISATATVPAASSVAASENHAVVLVFVDQAVTVGNDAPSATDSVVQVTLDKTGNRWLISGFDPK